MKFPGIIVLIIALMAQAMPWSSSASGVERVECGTSCSCDSGAAGCCCVESPEGPFLPLPPNAPPSTGRELLAPPHWVECVIVEPGESTEANFMPRFRERSPDARGEVRLTVLFCSIQI